MKVDKNKVEELIKKVNKEVDVVSVISKYIDLNQVGRGFIGKCPFHDDQHDSFAVYPANNRFICFAASCGVTGGPVDFVARYEGVSRIEAALMLAREYNVDIDIKNIPRYSLPKWVRELYNRALKYAEKRDPILYSFNIGKIPYDKIKKFASKLPIEELDIPDGFLKDFHYYLLPVFETFQDNPDKIVDIIFYPSILRYPSLKKVEVFTYTGQTQVAFGTYAISTAKQLGYLRIAWHPATAMRNFLQQKAFSNLIGGNILDIIPLAKDVGIPAIEIDFGNPCLYKHEFRLGREKFFEDIERFLSVSAKYGITVYTKQVIAIKKLFDNPEILRKMCK